MAELVRLQPPGRSNTNHTREKGTTMTERTFRIQTGHWHDNRGGHGMSLNIQDDLSGVTVADIRLTPEQAYDLFRGSTLEVTAHHGPLDRVGKQMVNDSLTYDSKDLGDHYWSDRDAKLAHAVELAKADLPGWESYEPRHTNSAGVTVVVRKWVTA